jgi:hypothetical protein
MGSIRAIGGITRCGDGEGLPVWVVLQKTGGMCRLLFLIWCTLGLGAPDGCRSRQSHVLHFKTAPGR